ncbi:hypothetical protein NE652_09785, partial [Bifidobacterium pseudocatenulatum]|nr:hypothetical protein [Bifidobacterium pseudocatenulatum]
GSLGASLSQIALQFALLFNSLYATKVWASGQTDNEKALTAIEEQQKQINDSVADLQSDEARAKKTLQRFSVEIRTIKRRVESLNLPGIPQDYMDYFFLVSDEIGKLADAISQ